MRCKHNPIHQHLTHLYFVLAIACGILCSTATTANAWQTDVKVTVAGISIARPKPNDEYGQSLVMGRSPGVEVHLRFESPTLHIIKVGESKGKTPKLSVSGGKELSSGERFSDFGFFSQIDEDGKAVTIPFSAAEVPPSGTAKLQIQGEIILTAGADPTSAEQKILLKAGQKVTLGTIACEIEEVSEDSFGDAGTIVNFKSKQSLEMLQELTFADAAGKEIESSSAGTSSFGFGGDMTYNTSYRLAGKPENVVAKVKFFKSTKDIPVKVDRTISLGLDD